MQERTVYFSEETGVPLRMECLRKFWKTYKEQIKQISPFLALFVYSFFGASMFYFLEVALLRQDPASVPEGANTNVTSGDVTEEKSDFCIGSVGFWGALFYVNTLYTTIGYGSVHPCHALTQCLSVIYALVGIPLVLVTLDKIGKAFSTLVKKIFVFYTRLKVRYFTQWRRRYCSWRAKRRALAKHSPDSNLKCDLDQKSIRSNKSSARSTDRTKSIISIDRSIDELDYGQLQQIKPADPLPGDFSYVKSNNCSELMTSSASPSPRRTANRFSTLGTLMELQESPVSDVPPSSFALSLKDIDIEANRPPVVVKRKHAEVSPEPVDDWAVMSDDEIEMANIPVHIGVLLTLSWILLCSAYFSWSEGWAYGTSIYFVFISLTTIGLGEKAPEEYQLTLIMFVFIFLGLSFVSTTINIIQMNIENLIARIQTEIDREYQAKLQRSMAGEIEEGEESPQEMVQRILDSYGMGWMANLIPTQQMQQVADKATTNASMVTTGVQATTLNTNQEVDATVANSDAEMSTVREVSDAMNMMAPLLSQRLTSTTDLQTSENKFCSTESFDLSWASTRLDSATSPLPAPQVFSKASSPPPLPSVQETASSPRRRPLLRYCRVSSVSIAPSVTMDRSIGVAPAFCSTSTQSIPEPPKSPPVKPVIKRHVNVETDPEVKPLLRTIATEYHPATRSVSVQVGHSIAKPGPSNRSWKF